jgi:riboflavin kinase/FMN adenylyltransferase
VQIHSVIRLDAGTVKHKVYRSLGEIRLHNSVIAIGVFDGVHRGHQKVLTKAGELARFNPGGRSIVLTFDKHPADLIAPHRAPMYLSSVTQRIEMIQEFSPVDEILVFTFDEDFADLTAHEFVSDVLVDHLGVVRVLVGADFRYGKGRAAGVMDLQAAGEAYHFGVEVVHSVANRGERVSSTIIRALVAEGNMVAAAQLLGHPFTLRGQVVQGKQLGRTIGYPTANVAPEQFHQILPSFGVYAGKVHLANDWQGRREWPAAISVGLNPTTDDDHRPKIEAYIMDGFSADIYGMSIDIDFIERLRDEQKFESLETLINQIDKDVAQVELLLSSQLK